MGYGALAEATVVVHLGWILFLIVGAIPGRRWRWVRWLHLGGLAFAIVLTARGWLCPLTHLEAWLRDRAGQGAYEETFIGHYAEKLVYLQVSRSAVLAGTAALAVLTILIYAWPRKGSE